MYTKKSPTFGSDKKETAQKKKKLANTTGCLCDVEITTKYHSRPSPNHCISPAFPYFFTKFNLSKL